MSIQDTSQAAEMKPMTPSGHQQAAAATLRYNRWQGLAIAQVSVAAALLSALSIAGLGTALALIQAPSFVIALQCRQTFIASFLLFFFCALFSVLVVVTRALDFRLTARMARKRGNTAYAKSLTIFWLTAESYGNLTWFFFWSALVSFLGAGAALAVSVASVYVPALLSATAG